MGILRQQLDPAAGGGGGGGAIALVSHCKYDSVGLIGGGTTGSMNSTGATLLVAVQSTYFFGGNTITDSKSNTWIAATVHGNVGGNDGDTCQIWYSTSPIVGSGHTFTTCGSGYPALAVAAFSGVSASPFDNENGNFGDNISSLTTGSITPSVNNCLVIAGMGIRDTPTSPFTINGGFTVTDSAENGAGLAYLIQTSAAAANPTWSWTSNAFGSTAIADFKP